MAEELGAPEYLLLGALVGGLIGGWIGALLTLLMTRRRREGSAGPALPADERRRRVQSLLDRASQVMIAYSAVIDAPPGAMRAAVERMRAVGVGQGSPLAAVDDPGVAAAAREFFAFVEQTQKRVDERIAAGRPETVAAELRARGEGLARAIARLHEEVSRLDRG